MDLYKDREQEISMLVSVGQCGAQQLIPRKRSGSASCWALGYSSESKSINNVNETIRRSLEKNPGESLNFVLSVGGGTGSGVTCAILEKIREEIDVNTPTTAILIFPFNSGDNPLQYYNAILSLSIIYNCAPSSSGAGLYKEINRNLATKIIGNFGSELDTWPSICQVCPDERLKFMSLGSSLSNKHSSFESSGILVTIRRMTGALPDIRIPKVTWRDDVTSQVTSESLQFFKKENDQNIKRSVNIAYNDPWASKKAEQLRNNNAYWHWYQSFMRIS
ncbi:hypothetical protein ROZALSC1DRAFT_27093 [Rozella allomycis CSF55]|uniref:Tubulin domain-containing protein n=1 Tax=Rozella allomycis (strain CSF55) TaxID=988480 RepID=A0A075AYB0_ROZAC|nr:Tubulin domain-containing protein [Rozella allomycis CSF55]RKP21509.1 hypothetical protein ROZALSC1DRAFT_27093 [Rozella allomycis CSF55]|eukprot:EPZ35315.1 Tubulin domain-containing protein [Rozella allomycis CSF55]